MRSKNLLPVQVVMPSNWMSVSQSSHKIAFEEALHNSIENSLRSPSVTPSAVFSSLFFTYRPSSATSTISTSSDTKLNTDDLDHEVVRTNPNSSEAIEQSNPVATSVVPYFHAARPPPIVAANEPRGPLAIQNVPPSDPSQSIQEQRLNLHSENRPAVTHAQLPILTQQQQLEQIQQARIEQFKQLQKIQAWQQMQKEQQHQTVGSRLMVQGPRDMRPPLIPAPTMRSSLPNVPRSTTTLIPPQLNGLQHNGVIPPIQTAFNLRHDRPAHTPMIAGFCKAGKDIRLARLEQDCSLMMPYPPEYVLLAIQPNLSRNDSAIVIALNLKSLPQANNSSQALSAQCIGCGEKSIHTFPQLSAHVGIELSSDTAHSRLNSTQLIGMHGRSYLVRDSSNPHKLVRGSPGAAGMWYKNNEAERMRVLQSAPQSNQSTANSSLIRGSMIMMSPPHQGNTAAPPQEPQIAAYPLMSPNYSSQIRPPLKRALSNPVHHNNPIEPGKRQYSSYSHDEVVVIQDDPTPKRYLLEEQVASWKRGVEIPEGFSNLHDTKPMIAFLYPTTNLPQFVGDSTSVIITSHFAECLKPLSQKAIKRLNFFEHCPITYSKFVLFSMVQYLIKLGANDTFSTEGISKCLMKCGRKLCDENASCFFQLKSSDILLISELATSGSNLVEIIHCKVSIAEALTECLKNYQPSMNKYFILVHIDNDNELSFHLFISGNLTRAIEESLRPRDSLSSIVSQGLVSLQFSQLRISLSEVAKQCYHNQTTSKLKLFNSNSSIPVSLHHACPLRYKQACTFASALHDKVEKILNESSDFEMCDFTSLRFLFLVPPSTSLLNETLKCISDSNIFSELHKNSHAVPSHSNQVIITIDENAVQRISSICTQLENTSTLLFLIQLDAHLTHYKSELFEYLNSPEIQHSKNLFHVQCTSYPYSLLTNQSRIPTSNMVCLDDSKNELENYNVGELSKSDFSTFTTYDPVYEEQKDHLCSKYQLLHSSLIICEILTHQYIASLAMTSSTTANCTGQYKQEKKCDLAHFTSPLVNQVIRNLFGLNHNSTGNVVIVRVTSSILATRFYDNLRQARHRLGLDETFEILLYSGDSVAPSIAVSQHFLESLQKLHDKEEEWRPTCLKDITGIPCLIVYVGDQLVSHTLPSTVKYVDCRMAFHGSLDRFHIEQELSFANPLCTSCSKTDFASEEMQSKPTLQNEATNNIHNHAQNNHITNEQYAEVNSTSYHWTPTKQKIENGFSIKEENSASKKEDMLLDFIGLAMKEANLHADENSPATHCCHNNPVVILPKNIYNVAKNKSRLSLRDLIPHSASKWKEHLHPVLENKSSFSDEVDFYREWTSPKESNPDFNNTEEVIHDNRILLFCPSSCCTQQVCCQFLHSINNDISKALEITVYDDPEEPFEISECGFHSLLPNNVKRGISQIVNSCTDCGQLQRYIAADHSKPERSVATRQCRYALTSVKRTKRSKCNAMTNGESAALIEYQLNIGTKEWILKDDGMELKIIIPSNQTDRFRFSVLEDGTAKLMSLKLMQKDDIGIKTPVVSLGIHGVKNGLYNLNTGNERLTHLVLVKSCDGGAYKTSLTNHIIVILPPEFDFLGQGALKYAAQMLFEDFYCKEKEYTANYDVIWPFFLLMNDDVVAFAKLHHSNGSQIDEYSSCTDLSFLELIQNFESVAGFDFAAFGFRPWSNQFPTAQLHGKLLGDNHVMGSCLESCMFLNCQSANTIKYSNTKFTMEDADWSIRASAIGLNLYRFENIAVITKVIEPLQSDVALENAQTPFVTTADSDFIPLCHHPALLLEKYLPQCAPLMFPRASGHPEHPVLCVDCYWSLGNQICIQFVSSQSNAKFWSINRCKQYGGLILSSPNINMSPEFLEGFQFLEGAVVCVIGTDRSSLRQTVVNLRLESSWHFRLTDEFLTVNHSVLGGVTTRPCYFLTGARKES